MQKAGVIVTKQDVLEREIEMVQKIRDQKESLGLKTNTEDIKIMKLTMELDLMKDRQADWANVLSDINKKNAKVTPYYKYLTIQEGEIIGVSKWDKLALKIAEDNNILKINGMLLDGDTMDLYNKSDLYGLISTSLNNSSPTIDALVANKIKSYIPKCDIEPSERYIVCANGRFDVWTGVFEKHTSKTKNNKEFQSLNKINIKYNTTADSKLGKEIIKRFVGNNIGFDKQFFEALGMSLWQGKAKQAIFANGDSNFGKSWLFDNFVAPVVGKNNFNTIRIADMNEESNASMANKTLAYDSDMSTRLISGNTVEYFKKATGDGQLKAKILYVDKFDFTNYATIWANCNGLPVWSDIGSGGSLDNRMNVMQFTVNVKRDFPDPTKEVKAQREEINKWLLKEALNALHEYYKRGCKFTQTLASQKAIEKTYKHNDTVDKFIKFTLIPNYKTKATGIPLTNVFKLYESTFLAENEDEGYNYGDHKLGKVLFNKSLRDKETEYGFATYMSGGKEKFKFLQNEADRKHHELGMIKQQLADNYKLYQALMFKQNQAIKDSVATAMEEVLNPHSPQAKRDNKNTQELIDKMMNQEAEYAELVDKKLAESRR